MALADTARLIAALELQDKFTGPAKRAEGSIGSLDKKMGTINQSGQKLGAGLSRAFSTIAKIGVGVAAGGLALLTVNIKKGVDSLNELEAQQVQTATVLESTNEIAGISAKTVRALAEEYEGLNATIDDKVIQSAENMLLTFTNVREDAFEPALEAVLNINQAMGGGEGGLQKVAIQVGKALNDPTKGLTALTRIGVTFSREQKERIKRLQEEGDLYGAQQIILRELGTEFGGQFAAAGRTAEGRMAKLGDTIEDLQQRLAGPLLPAIDRVRDKLISILSTDRAGQAAQKIGEAIASIFSQPNIDKGASLIGDLLDRFNSTDFKDGFQTATANLGTIATTVGGLPWGPIGDAAKLLGTGSKALLDAFLGLPPWVQTAVLTGWGLNKLTGGAVGGIVAELGKGLIKGVLGMNAGVVNINAATVNGPVGGVPGVGGGIGSTLARTGALASIPLAGIAAVEVVKFLGETGDLADDVETKIDTLIKNTGTDLPDINDSIMSLDNALKVANDSQLAAIVTTATGTQDRLREERAELLETRNELARNIVRGTDQTSRTIDRVNNSINLERSAQQAIAAADAARINSLRDSHRAANSTLQQIRDKRSNINVTVNQSTSVVVAAQNVVSQVQAFTYTRGGVYAD